MPRYQSPAKINLFLHVLSQRSDGYHDLQTAFQFLDFVDLIDIEIDASGDITRTGGLESVADEDDLAIRAARLLRSRLGITTGATIAIDKRIPDGAGLGGGSSNAATVLLALNELWSGGLSHAELADLGRILGADVPVFVGGRAAFAEGTGERLTPWDFPEVAGLLVVPPVKVPTADVFGAPELTRNTPPITIPVLDLADLTNNLEAVTRKMFPEVALTLDELESWCLEANLERPRMSGSGGSVFSLSRRLAAAEHPTESLSELATEFEQRLRMRHAQLQHETKLSPGSTDAMRQWMVLPIKTQNISAFDDV